MNWNIKKSDWINSDKKAINQEIIEDGKKHLGNSSAVQFLEALNDPVKKAELEMAMWGGANRYFTYKEEKKEDEITIGGKDE